MRVHGGLLGGEEEDVVEVAGRGQLGGADGESGLAHATRAINERAPAGGVGMEVGEELGEFGVATEEALDGGEVGAGIRQRNADRGMGSRVLIPLSAFLCRIGPEPAEDVVEVAVGVEAVVALELG